MSNKKDLSERDICTQFILPALVKSGWDVKKQVREEVFFTDGRIFVKGNKTIRGKRKRADYILYLKPNIPIAVIEAKDNNHSVEAGLQQALGYANKLISLNNNIPSSMDDKTAYLRYSRRRKEQIIKACDNILEIYERLVKNEVLAVLFLKHVDKLEEMRSEIDKIEKIQTLELLEPKFNPGDSGTP